MVQQITSGEKSLCLRRANKKVPKTISERVSAFAIFFAVYTQKFASEAGKLLKYDELIRQIASDGGNFNVYDVAFRKLSQTMGFPWDHFHTELYLKSLRGFNAMGEVRRGNYQARAIGFNFFTGFCKSATTGILFPLFTWPSM